jgi:hypothetical protein
VSGHSSVEFGFKLQGDRELSDAAERAFATRIAGDPCVRDVTGTHRPARGSIRVTATVMAGTRTEAEARSGEILSAAGSAAGKEIPDWSTVAWWSSSRVESTVAWPGDRGCHFDR